MTPFFVDRTAARARASTLALVASLLAIPSMAAPPDDEEDAIESLSGKPLPELDTSRLPEGRWTQDNAQEPPESAAQAGARMLGVSPDYVRRTRAGLELVFQRDYKAARQHFRKLDADEPGTGISGTVDALVWQALMLENFDFRYDRQYNVSNKAAIDGLEQALKDPAHQAWEHFQLAGLKGVEAIHMVRQGSYVSALNRAFEAMDHVQSSRAASPSYTDLGLADGMYNYWRTVVTLSSKMLPSFGDHRALGLRQLQEVEKTGIFLREPATLALAFSWIEERKFAKAAAACERNRARFPDNVINNLLLGSSYTFLRRYDEALKVYEGIIETSPDNNRVYYFMGLTKSRMGKTDEGIAHLERYLASDHLEDWQRAYAHYRLGQAYYRLKEYGRAEGAYRQAIKIDSHRPAKRSLDRMKTMRKEGRISW